MNNDLMTPDEAIERIRTPGQINCSCNTRLALQRLANDYEQMKKALDAFKSCHRMLEALPELNMANYVESEVQALNDGVIRIYGEMDVIEETYLASKKTTTDLQPD